MGAFERDLEKTLQNAFTHIYLDFSEVEEVSSAILGILLHKKMKMRKKGIEIYLLNASTSVQRILKILNLSSHLLSSRGIDRSKIYSLNSV
jgi:anti-anti-sigma factor